MAPGWSGVADFLLHARRRLQQKSKRHQQIKKRARKRRSATPD